MIFFRVMSKEIFVSTYNILMGFDNKVYDSIENIKKLSKNTNYQFFNFQELRNTDENKDMKKKFQSLFPKLKGSFYIYPKVTCDRLGLGSFSNLKKLNETRVELPTINGPFNPHKYICTESAIFGVISTVYELPNKKTIRISNAHLEIIGNMKYKKKKIKHILSHFKEKVDYEIFCGDMNTVGLANFFKRLLMAHKKQFLNLLGKGFIDVKLPRGKYWTSDIKNNVSPTMKGATTFRKLFVPLGIHVRQRLDWIFVKNLKPTFCDVLYDCVGSDHYPLVAK